MTENQRPDEQDVEGHRRKITDDEAVEGHRFMVTDEDEDDVEGHVQPPRDLGIDR